MKKKKKKKTRCLKTSFKTGSVVVWDHTKFNPEFWDKLPESDRIKYYGALGYGNQKPKLFVFLTPIFDITGMDTGHCVLVSLDDQSIETMRHTNEFRLATENEF